MDTYALWHTKEERFLTLYDLQPPCPRAVALYVNVKDAEYDIEHRVAKKDKPFIEIQEVF